MSLFSIIIPTYNSSKTIKETIDSVVHQTFEDFEILIMDGLSTDETITIVKSFNDNRIQIFSEKDKGVYDAMNKGIEKANGKWLYFLGSDDTLYDINVLDNVNQVIDSAECDVIYGDAWFLKAQYRHQGQFSRLKLMTTANICHQAIFYSNILFERLGGYNLEFKYWADWDFNIRAFSIPNIRVKYMDLVVSNYNDYNGFSKEIAADETFEKYLNLDNSGEIIAKFSARSKEYVLGKKILDIARRCRKIFSRS